MVAENIQCVHSAPLNSSTHAYYDDGQNDERTLTHGQQ